MRIDLTDWLVHFVHRGNADDRAWMADGDLVPWPLRFQSGAPTIHADAWEVLDNQYTELTGMASDAAPFFVLLKILNDGHIRAGWSIRNGRPTIYGPRPAVCLTEMPLHALLDYARRRDDRTVSPYGIALLRSEVYAAGGRPVIYGLTGEHAEAQPGDGNYMGAARCLGATCGLGVHEQYRYVATRLGGPSVIDWTHEREWRWTADFVDDVWAPPGLPVWLSEPRSPFTKRLVIVATNAEAKRFVDQMKRYYDAGINEWALTFDKTALAQTRVVSIEDLGALTTDAATVRLDDLPFRSLPAITPCAPTAATVEKVKGAIAAARMAARRAVEEARRSNPNSLSTFGFASVITSDAHTEVTEALLELGYAHASGSFGWYAVDEVTRGLDTEGLIHYASIGAEAAAAVLEAGLGQTFDVHCRDD